MIKLEQWIRRPTGKLPEDMGVDRVLWSDEGDPDFKVPIRVGLCTREPRGGLSWQAKSLPEAIVHEVRVALAKRDAELDGSGDVEAYMVRKESKPAHGERYKPYTPPKPKAVTDE